MNFNKAILIGRITQDPKIKNLPSGQPVCSFGLATNRYFNDKSGEKRQEIEFHNIVMFGKLAEIASKYLKKGSLTMVEGRIRTRSWQDAAGNQRSRTEIIAQSMQMGPRAAGREVPGEIPGKEASSTEEIPIIEEEVDIKDVPF